MSRTSGITGQGRGGEAGAEQGRALAGWPGGVTGTVAGETEAGARGAPTGIGAGSSSTSGMGMGTRDGVWGTGTGIRKQGLGSGDRAGVWGTRDWRSRTRDWELGTRDPQSRGWTHPTLGSCSRAAGGGTGHTQEGSVSLTQQRPRRATKPPAVTRPPRQPCSSHSCTELTPFSAHSSWLPGAPALLLISRRKRS